MAAENAQPDFVPPTRVIYHSYLLRIRRVVDEEGDTRQIYVQSIPCNEEKYFGSLGLWSTGCGGRAGCRPRRREGMGRDRREGGCSRFVTRRWYSGFKGKRSWNVPQRFPLRRATL